MKSIGKELTNSISLLFVSGVRFPLIFSLPGMTSSRCSCSSSAPAGIPLIPTQLYESVFCLLLSGFLVFVFLREKRVGTSLGFYCILYSIWRFIIEFYRSDDRGTVGALSTSQFICIFLFFTGLVLLYLVFKKKLPLIQRHQEETMIIEVFDGPDNSERQTADGQKDNEATDSSNQTEETDGAGEENE